MKMSWSNLLRCSVALCLVFSGGASAATLSEVIANVVQQHPNVRAGQAQVNAAEAQISVARSSYLPTLGVNVQDVSSRDTQFGVNLDRDARRTDAVMRWNLYRGLADRSSIMVAKTDREATSAELDDARERAILQVSQAYIDVLRLRRLISLGEDYIADHLRLGENIRKRTDVGRASMADVDQVQMGLIQAEAQQSQLRGQLAGAELRYYFLTGTEPADLSDPKLSHNLSAAEMDGSLERLQSENHRVRAAYMRAEARTAEVGIVGGTLFPTLDLELRKRLHSDITPAPVTDTQRSTMISLNYEIPLGGANFSRKRQALEKSAAAKATADATLLETQGTLAQISEEWQEARIIAPRLEQRVEASQRVVAAYDLQFEAGKRSLNDLINARGSRYQAQSDRVNNFYTQINRQMSVLSYLGILGDALMGSKQ